MGNRALVADDDPELLATVAASVAELGMGVRCAENGVEFIRHLAESGPFDIILTDISMPWMSGLQAALVVRNAGLTMPIVMMTGLQNERVLRMVTALGPSVVLLHKPFGHDELVASVRSALAQSASDGPRCAENTQPAPPSQEPLDERSPAKRVADGPEASRPRE